MDVSTDLESSNENYLEQKLPSNRESSDPGDDSDEFGDSDEIQVLLGHLMEYHLAINGT